MDWAEVARATTLSVPDRLSIDLERLILEHKLEPGEKLPAERDLAKHFGVSRPSVRDALKELESRGLISRKPGRGTVVLGIGERASGLHDAFAQVTELQPEIRDIMELRAIIEPPIAGIAAKRAMPRDLTQLRELVELMEQDISKERYAECDRAFHQAIAEYTHNSSLAFINEQIAQLIAPSRAKRLQTKARRRASSVAHRRIYEAISAGNAELAEQEARSHVLAISREIARASEITQEQNGGEVSDEQQQEA